MRRDPRTRGDSVAVPFAVAVAATVAACATAVKEPLNLFAVAEHDPWEGPLRLEWQRELTEATPWEYKPIERGSVALNDSRDRLYVGNRLGSLFCVAAINGREVWRRELGVPISSQPLYHEGTLYVGTDGGDLVALHPETGATYWKFPTKGLVQARAAVTEDHLFFTDSRNTLYALNPLKGTYAWHYNRDVPEGFTVTGHGAPRVFGELLVAGFSDGKLMGLSASDGSVIWEADLAGAARFKDVDATPVFADGKIIAASYSGGVFAIDPEEGKTIWQHKVDGATRAAVRNRRVIISEAPGGMRAIALNDGRLLWRTRLSSGSPTAPVWVGGFVAVGMSRAAWPETKGSIVLVNPRTGAIVQELDVGVGFSAPLTSHRRDLYALSNGGTLYKLRLVE